MRDPGIRLPNRESAYVPEQKLTEYLLSETHPIGRAKAFLLRALGYDNINVDLLEHDLLTVAHEQPVAEVIESEYGVKYVIDGVVHTPSGSALLLRTVWIIDTAEERPRFVTAYPV